MIPASAAWAALTAELDLWAAEGRMVHFWWRDDDAVAASPALERLIALHRSSGIPLALAIIPARLQDSLVVRLEGEPGIAALQHGHAHANHAAAGEKKSEFPASRPPAERLADLRAGQDILHRRLGPRLQPVFVPPWNRLAPDSLPDMAALGFTAISAFAARKSYWAAPNLAWLNTHIDPIDWHGGDNAAGIERSLAAAVALLRAMRQGRTELQPVGLLTHHLRHDPVVWDFLQGFLAATQQHAAVRWTDVPAALPIAAPHAVTPTS